MARFLNKYREQIVPSLMEKYKYGSIMEVPKLIKISLNMGIGEAVSDKKIIEKAVSDMELISGQKVVTTKASQANSGFKIRENQIIGCMVTLRGSKMYEFLDRLITIALPRVRDFRGQSSRSFDGRGNYNFGIKEQIIFPEIEYDKVDAIRGLNVTIVTSSKSDDECKSLLAGFKFPFK